MADTIIVATTMLSGLSWCILMSCAYVGILYAVPKSIRVLPRDHPTHICYRSVYVLLLSIFLSVVVRYYLLVDTKRSWETLGYQIDFSTKWAIKTLSPVLLTALLFTGPCVAWALETLVSPYRPRLPTTKSEVALALRVWVIGPVTEEMVFRCCMIPVLLQSGFSTTSIIIGSPSLFGIAHLHHALEHVRQGRSIKQALAIVVFQLCYTSIFGAFVSHIFLKSRNVISITLIHSFCNLMGFPDLGFATSNSFHPLAPYRTLIWTAYGCGIWGFWYFF